MALRYGCGGVVECIALVRRELSPAEPRLTHFALTRPVPPLNGFAATPPTQRPLPLRSPPSSSRGSAVSRRRPTLPRPDAFSPSGMLNTTAAAIGGGSDDEES